jgi:hypothetical protein
MDGDKDLTQLDDPEFLAERRRVREELEQASGHSASPELAARYQQLDDEFIRRAAAAWNKAR